MRVDFPSIDAAAHIGDRIRAAEAAALRQYEDLAAARAAVAAIKAIPAIDLTPAVAAQIAGVLSGCVGRASWSHFKHVDDALAFLDDASDTLNAVGLE